MQDNTRLATTIVNRIEVLKGRFDFLLKAANGLEFLRANEWIQHDDEKLAELEIIPVTQAAAVLFDRLRLDKKLKKTDHADLLIACIALSHNATLVTRNTKDFAGIPNLKLENWAD